MTETNRDTRIDAEPAASCGSNPFAAEPEPVQDHPRHHLDRYA
jgi:hypothetical protein